MHLRADGSSTTTNYWDVLDHVRPSVGRQREALAGEVLALLSESVLEHNLSDVPLGLLLSGGVDSSAIATLAVAAAGRPLPSFTIGYTGAFPSCPDETGYARLASARAGTTYYQKTLSPEEFEAGARPLISALAEPCSTFHLPLSAVAGMARAHGVRVLQGGEGADEVFLGYDPYLRCLGKESRRIFPPLSSQLRRSIGKVMPASQAKLKWTLPGFAGIREAFNERQLQTILGPEMKRSLIESAPLAFVEQRFERFLDRSPEHSMQQWMGYLDLHMRLASSFLPKLDVITMQHGIECRFPFLDHRLVELAFSIPGAFKMHAGASKVLLKSAVRGLIPDPVIDRHKQGLSTPFEEWYRTGLGERMRQTVLDFSARTGLLESGGVDQVFREDARRAWYLYAFALWHSEFIEAAACPPHL